MIDLESNFLAKSLLNTFALILVMPSKIVGALIEKFRHPFEPKGYVRKLLFKKPLGRVTRLRQIFTTPDAKVGRIEIYQGPRVVGSLSYRRGKDIAAKLRPKEIRDKDVYVDIGEDNAVVVSGKRRGSRIGVQLITELINHTKQETGGNVYLRVELYNKHARQFYDSIGFKPIRLVDGCMLMVKKSD